MFERTKSDTAPVRNQPHVVASGRPHLTQASPVTAQAATTDDILAGSSGAELAVVELSRPLATHAGEISRLVLKTPKWGDAIDFGEIDRVHVLEIHPETNAPTRMEHSVDTEALLNWAVALTGQSRLILRELSLSDGRNLEKAVRRVVQGLTGGNSQPA